MSEPRAVRADALDTVDGLLNVAERLFAEKGVERVALTEIVTRSGQKNRSALHYHFKSRAGVLNAVLDRRLAAINLRRGALLDEVEAQGDAFAILRSSLLALALVVVEEPWGAHYVSIAAQLIGRLERLVDQGVDQENFSAQRRSRALLSRALPEVDRETMAQRLRWFNGSALLELARWVRATPPEARTPAVMGALVDQLAAYGAAALGAPSPPSAAGGRSSQIRSSTPEASRPPASVGPGPDGDTAR